VAWLARLEVEHDNLRAALAWADDQSQGDTLLRLAGELARFWRFHWHRSEGERWLDRALARGDGAPTAWRAKALLGAGIMANMRLDYPWAAARHREALAMSWALGDRRNTARALLFLGEATGALGDAAGARILFDESLELLRDLGDKPLAAVVLKNLGQLARQRGDAAEATACLEDALALSQEAGFGWGRAEALIRLADVMRDRRELSRGNGLFADALALYGEQGETEGMAPQAVGAVAAITGERRWSERAARLFGAAATLHASASGDARPAPENAPAVRVAPDGETFAAALAAGRALTVEQAVAEATDLAAELAAEFALPA
jgi:tetratricopeptide (TPR) repeat protein